MEIFLAVKHLIFEAAVSRISGVITEQTISFCCLWKNILIKFHCILLTKSFVCYMPFTENLQQYLMPTYYSWPIGSVYLSY